jgi:2,3-bisphosphoglycerate-independent phosphoglycerate mutase
VDDTDPQVEGVPPRAALPRDPAAQKTARVADAFAAAAREALAGREVAHGVLLRGFSTRPPLPSLGSLARLRPLAFAAYPAYRGVARLLGMDLHPDVGLGTALEDSVAALERAWGSEHDFYFLHVKATDSAGEDGREDRKAEAIETFDAFVPRLRALEPDVTVVTGDHSTPGPMAGHSWHPVPTLLHGPWCEPDDATTFDEAACHGGRLGPRLPATALLRLALANAGKLAKFGA